MGCVVKFFLRLPIMLGVLAISGCELLQINSAVGFADNQMSSAMRKAEKNASHYMDKVRIPEVKDYEGYKISSEIEDPFTFREFAYIYPTDVNGEIVIEETDECAGVICVDAPDPARRKSFLENYDIEELKYVGLITMPGSQEAMGLISTPDVGVVKVKIGDYIGKDSGLIVKLHPRVLVMKETVRQGQIWRSLQRNMPISKRR